MVSEDYYDQARSAQEALAKRLYGSSSTISQLTSTTITPAPATSASFYNNATPYPADKPFFWPLVFARVSEILHYYLWERLLLPLFYYVVVPGLVLWISYLIFLKFYPNAQGIIDSQPAIVQFRSIVMGLPRDCRLVWRRLRWGVVGDTVRFLGSRGGYLLRDYWFVGLVLFLLLSFVIGRIFGEEGEGQLRAKIFSFPDYMVWPREEEGSNYVGYYRREKGERGVERKDDEGAFLLAEERRRRRTTTTEGELVSAPDETFWEEYFSGGGVETSAAARGYVTMVVVVEEEEEEGTWEDYHPIYTTVDTTTSTPTTTASITTEPEIEVETYSLFAKKRGTVTVHLDPRTFTPIDGYVPSTPTTLEYTPTLQGTVVQELGEFVPTRFTSSMESNNEGDRVSEGDKGGDVFFEFSHQVRGGHQHPAGAGLGRGSEEGEDGLRYCRFCRQRHCCEVL